MLVRSDALERVISEDGTGPYLSTVVAPSGYGKTRFLRQLMERGGEETRTAYLSVADAEQHVGLFVNMIIAGIREACPEAGLAPLLQLQEGDGATVDENGARVAYVLSRIPKDVDLEHLVLLFDDLDTLREGAPLARLIGRLVRCEPRGVRFVLCSRTSVPVDLESYRAEGTCVEVTSDELALDLAETTALLEAETGSKRYAPLTEEILERTQGWPGVTIVLARVIAGQKPKQARALVTQMPTQETGLTAFVVERILSARRPPVQYVMKRIAVLEHVEPAAAVALFKDTRKRGGVRPGNSAVISLKKAQVLDVLETLEEEQILSRRVEDGPLVYIPLVRDALRSLLEDGDPDGFADAHRRAATFYMDRGDKVGLSAIDHLIAAREPDRALAVLKDNAEGLAATGGGQRLGRWLESMEEAYTTLPFWAYYHLGRAATDRAAWDTARRYLDRCKAGLASQPEAQTRWQPRLSLGYANLYWRRGMYAEASTYCRRGIDYLRQVKRRMGIPKEHEAELFMLHFQLLDLLGTAKIENGSYRGARLIFDDAHALAKVSGFTREVALALTRVGLIAVRQGRVADAQATLQRALEVLKDVDDRELFAWTSYLLGLQCVMSGEFGDGLERMHQALELVVEAGKPSTIVRILTTLGRVQNGVGRLAEAEASFQQALRVLESHIDPRARAEVLDHWAIVLAANGRPEEAAILVTQATSLVEGRLRTDVHVAAWHGEAVASLAAAKGEYPRAFRQLQRAIDRFDRLGAAYQVARLSWRYAVWQHAAFVVGHVEDPEEGLASLERACELAAQWDYAYEAEPRGRELLYVALAYGEGNVLTYAQRVLTALGEPTEGLGPLRGLGAEAAARYRQYRRRAELDEEYILTTRDGTEGANASKVNDTVSRFVHEGLVLWVDRQLLKVGTNEVSLAEKRVIMPLLMHFLRHPGGVFTMADLARAVWGAEDGTKMQTKVKVAVSRLRALIGKERNVILTTRVDQEGRGNVVAYMLSLDVKYLLVEHLEE